jgi:hypothetical protein
MSRDVAGQPKSGGVVINRRLRVRCLALAENASDTETAFVNRYVCHSVIEIFWFWNRERIALERAALAGKLLLAR